MTTFKEGTYVVVVKLMFYNKRVFDCCEAGAYNERAYCVMELMFLAEEYVFFVVANRMFLARACFSYG